MSKYVNVTVSTCLSTDFYLEVPDDATEEQIKELAMKEVVLPHKYPEEVDKILNSSLGIRLRRSDSMFRDWNVDETEYIINDA